jgi:glycosyltransferase involved in cell wall biosynthesis
MAGKVAVFHPGTQHSWQTAQALQDLDRLAFYATSIFYQPDRWPYRIERYLPERYGQRVHAEFRRFSHPALDPRLVRTSGLSEWLERVAQRGGLRRLARTIDAIGNRAFARSLRSEVALASPFALWGYSGSSLDAFRAAKEQGRLRVLDRTIGDWRVYNAALDEVHERYAEFFPTSGWRISQAQIDRDDAEYALADVIVTGSPFAAETVRHAAADRSVAERVRVLNYCFDERLFGTLPPPIPRSSSGAIRFLFLGQAGVRKGIHLILKVFERVPSSAATLTVVGDLQVPPAVWARYADRVTYRATVARADVPRLLQDHDILLFPTYFEGGGIVLYEALAAGNGLIQSSHAALAVTKETGILLSELSEEALLAAVSAAIDDRARVEHWRQAAHSEAVRYGFAQYRAGVARVLDVLDERQAQRS